MPPRMAFGSRGSHEPVTDLQALMKPHLGPRELPLAAAEDMFLIPPEPIEGPDVFGSACFNQSGAMFVEDDAFALSFKLVEHYPVVGQRWPWDLLEADGSRKSTGYYDAVAPAAADTIGVQVFDGISGADDVEETYDASETFGFAHTVLAADPNPFAPFTLSFEARFDRASDLSEIIMQRSAIVLGVKPEDVPQTFTMTTEPTLIFAVLRDPPGGGSFASLARGTEISTSMAIDGMHSGTFASSESYNFNSGLGFELSAELAPWGFGFTTNIFQVGISNAASHGAEKPSIGVERASSQHYDLSFTFDVAISTSEEPTIAGQPSDLILGGGANLRVLTAVEISLSEASEANLQMRSRYCVEGATTYEWLPEQITTYLLSVFEIENTMDRLSGVEQTDRVQQSIANWHEVLATYRAETKSNALTMKAGVDAMIASVTDKLQTFAAETDDVDQFKTFLYTGLERLGGLRQAAAGKESSASLAGLIAIGGTYILEGISDYNDIRSDEIYEMAETVERYTRNGESNCNSGDQFGLGDLCGDFAALKNKTALLHEVMGLCDFDTELDSVETFCRTPKDPTDESLPSRVFDALSDQSHLVTFSGGSVMEMAWSLGETKGRETSVGYTADAADTYGSTSTFCLGVGARRMQERAELRRAAAEPAPARRLDAMAAFKGGGMAKKLAGNAKKNHHDKTTVDAMGGCRRLLEDELDGRLAAMRGGGDHRDEGRRLADAAEARLHAHLAAARAKKNARRRLAYTAGFEDVSESSASLSVAMGRTNVRDDSSAREVMMTFTDSEPGDFFAVRIESDSVYGTPIFTTMGGVSSCPGETGTSQVDAAVTIYKVEYHCNGADMVPTGDCQNLESGSMAMIGVIVQNMSPTGGNPVMLLMLGTFDAWHDGKYTSDYCGAEGNSQGLSFSIAGGDFDRQGYLLDELEYGQNEIYMGVEESGFDPTCHEFNDVGLMLFSECEYNGDTYQNDPYQYLTEMDPDTKAMSVVHPHFNLTLGEFDEDTQPVGLSGDEASFSVSWEAPASNAPAPTAKPTGKPTHAPTRATLALRVDIDTTFDIDAYNAETGESYTAAQYCDDYAAYEGFGDLGVDDIQAYVLSKYVAALGWAATVECGCVVVDSASAEYSTYADITFFADEVIDRAEGVTEDYVEAKIQTVLDAKIDSGDWTADQRGVVDGTASIIGRRLEPSTSGRLFAFLSASKPSHVAISETRGLTPTATPTTHEPTRSPKPTPAPKTRAPAPKPTTLLGALKHEVDLMTDDEGSMATASAEMAFAAALIGLIIGGGGVFMVMSKKKRGTAEAVQKSPGAPEVEMQKRASRDKFNQQYKSNPMGSKALTKSNLEVSAHSDVL